MRKLVLAALAAGTVMTVVTPAHAADPVGAKCAFNSATDVAAEAGWQSAVLRGGPLVTQANGSLHCTIVVNADTHVAASASPYGVSFSATAGVAVVGGPVSLRYRATAADDVSLCTKWVPSSGPTLYWTSQTAPNLGFWSTDAGASCGVALSIEPNYPTCPLWLTADKYLGTPIAEIWQDCEPYEPII